MSSEQCKSASSSARIRQTEFAPPSSLGVSRINHILRVHGHTIPRSHGGQHDTSNPQRWPVWNWVREEHGTSLPSCTPGSSHRSQTHIRLRSETHFGQAFRQSTPLGTRPAAVVETATPPISAPLMTKMKLYVQKAAQAADEAWQQTMGGLQGPGVANPTIASLENPGSRRTAMTWTS